jgi:hypothetical protein
MDEHPRRTIVFSDAHGEPAIIRAVVEHSGYDAERDRLIFAGDAIEVGRDSLGCLELLEELGAECLVGNHEYAAYTRWPLEGDVLDTRVTEFVEDALRSGRWKLAAEADDVLITHAGVSDELGYEFGVAGDSEVRRFVDALNEEFSGTVEIGANATEGAIDTSGPLWYRPGEGSLPLPGLTQIVGHTPLEFYARFGTLERWQEAGLYFVDPFVRGWRERAFVEPVPFRYAVIEDGDVTFVERGLSWPWNTGSTS